MPSVRVAFFQCHFPIDNWAHNTFDRRPPSSARPLPNPPNLPLPLRVSFPSFLGCNFASSASDFSLRKRVSEVQTVLGRLTKKIDGRWRAIESTYQVPHGISPWPARQRVKFSLSLSFVCSSITVSTICFGVGKRNEKGFLIEWGKKKVRFFEGFDEWIWELRKDKDLGSYFWFCILEKG